MSNGNSTQIWRRPEPAPAAANESPVTPKVDRANEQRQEKPKSKIPAVDNTPSEKELSKESGRVGSRIETVVVRPPEGFVASNPQADRRSYYVNGIVLEREALVEQLREIAKVRGTPVTAIINDQEEGVVTEQGFLSAVLNGAAGVISSRLGSAVESKAVQNLMHEIKTQVINRQGRMHIDAHSQGSIITSNALRLLQSELKPSDWRQVCERLDVSTFGAAIHLFPRGVKVNEYVHSGDLVATSSTIASVGRQELARLTRKALGGLDKDLDAALPTVMKEPEKCTITDDSCSAHDALGYIKDIPKFFVASYRNEQGNLQLKSLAEGLVRAIKNGRFSDVTVGNILSAVDKEDPKGYVRNVIQAESTRQGLGKFSLKK